MKFASGAAARLGIAVLERAQLPGGSGKVVQGFQDGCCAGCCDLPSEVDVGRHGGVRVAELICRGSRRQAGLVHQGGDGLAEDVGRHPVKAGRRERIT